MPEVITNHLDLWTSALLSKSSAGRGSNGKLEAYGIKKLREIILALAVRGMLVPQVASDEPASDLRGQIAKEKAQMVKEGVIRTEKNFPVVTNEEVPFAAPNGWEWVRINDVGHDWGQKQPEGDFTYIDVSAIDNVLGVIKSPSILSATDAPSRARKIVKVGTVIYSTVRPYLRNICVIEEEYSPEPIASTAFAVLHPLQEMPGGFVASYLRSPQFVKHVESIQTGIAYPAINDKQFYGSVFPLPPLNEQHRIVAKVDELNALCDQLEKQQTQSIEAHQALVETLLGTLTRVESYQELSEAWTLIANHFDTLFTTQESIDQLKQTILQLAVMGKLVPQDPNDEPETILRDPDEVLVAESPFEIPYGWAWSRLSDLAQINGGFAFRSTDYKEEGMRVVRISDFDEFGFKDHKVVRHPFTSELNKFSLDQNNILMAMTGGTVGKSYLVRSLPEPMIVNQRVATIKVSGRANPSYVDIVIRSEMTQEIIRKAKNSTNDNISMGDIKGFAIPFPPRVEQDRIVVKVDELMALCDTLKAHLADAQATQIHLADAIVEQAVE